MNRQINSKIDKNSIYELYRACRLCGAGAGYKMPIIQNVIDADGDEVDLKQKIRECVQIEVHQDDKMPPLICELCVDKVNDFYVFLDLCRQTNKRTRQRLGLPMQSTHKGNSDSGDCILGMTEPVYVNDDSDEPLSKSSPRNSKHKGSKSNKPLVKVKVEKPEPRDSRHSRGVKSSPHAGQKRPAPPEPGPRVTRHARNTNDDNITLNTLRHHSKRSPSSLPPAPKSILKKEPKREREQLTLRSKRTQEPPKTTVPLKRVKLTVKLPPKPEKPKPPPPPPGIKCAICRHLSKTPQANSNHLRSHTVTFTSSKLACNACREWFSDAEAAAAHHRRHEARSKAYMCRTCRARRATYKQYLAHTESGDCVPWDEVPDVQCSECWKYFPTDNLRTQHKCPGEEGRPGGKCSKCSRTYTLMKNLKKHESTCTAKKRGEVPIDPELMAKVRPIQVRTVRCDPLLERVQNGHYDISDVPENYGLDPDRVYPYINSASLNFNRMVNIKTDLLDFYCEDDYIHWDSDNSTEDEIVEKDKEVDSLTTLSLKTLFSQKCLGRVPRKKRKVKTEKSMFDSILGNDFDMSKDINSIIDNLGDDDDTETKTEDVNNDSKISDATVSVGIDSEDKDREVNVTDESANLDDSNKKVKSEDNDKVDGVSVSNDESKNNVEDESKVSGGSYDKLQVNNSEGKVQLDESSNGKPEANDKSDDNEQINDSTDDKAKINDSSDDKLFECNADGKNTNEDSVEKINDENESSKGIEVDKMEVNEKSIDKNNHETDPSTNVTESESIGDDINIDSSVSKKEENGEQHCENLDFNEKEVEKLNVETNENIKDTPDAVNVVDSTNIDKDSLRVSDVDLRSDSKENKNVPENDKNPEDKKSDETEASGEVSTDCDIVKSRDLTAKGADDIKETIENDIKQSVEVNDTIIPEKDKGNGVRSMETDKEDFIDSETGDKKENIEQSDLTDEHIQKPGDDNSLTSETQKINDDTVKMNGDFDGRTDKTKTDELTDSEIDDKKLMDALNEHIGETDENDVTNDKTVDADRATDKDAKAFEVKRTDEQHTYDNTHENKITLEDLVPSKEKPTPSMDLDSISDDEFNFDS
ncbi:unnamed protein product [Chilo suppressalis]|uniref:ZAD domain-containing protein n=1 Tax=Chilo suppressalis TaxID=168631 RepID=A0ABN8EFN7_CHISP|nr:unnamed protein product [Chilo suppressalis]